MKSSSSINYRIKNFLIPQIESKSESFAHKAIKQLFHKKILENNPNIIEVSLEKYFKSRRADVYFKFNTGQEVVVEIQSSPITSREITIRTKDYNNRGIYVLWVLYGDGKCVGSPKNPRNSKNVKISPAEMRLHQLYRGRVYYVNIKYQDQRITATLPFALHFSNSDIIAPILFRKKFHSIFYRNVNFNYIPNWNILCTVYNDYKIARFYDQNVRSKLIEDLREFNLRNNIHKNMTYYKSKKTKKYFKIICKVLEDEFGKQIIISALLRLIAKKELLLNKKFLKKHQSRLKRKAISKINKIKF